MRSQILFEILALSLLLGFSGEIRCLGQSALWQSYLKKGTQLMEQANYSDAEKMLSAAVQELDLNTDSKNNIPFVFAHFQLASCLQKENKLTESEAEYLKTFILAQANETEVNFLMAYDSLANVQVQLKKYDLAEENYRKCLRKLEDRHSGLDLQRQVLQDLISLYSVEGKTAESSALNDQIANLDVQIKQIQSQPKYFYDQGLRALAVKDFPKSIELFEKAISLAPMPLYTVNLAVAHQNYAVLLDGKDDHEAEHHYKEAIKLFEKENRAQSQLADAIEGLVILYVKDKRYTDADPYVTRLLTLRNQQKNMVGYTRAHKLYTEAMKAQNKPIAIGAIPAGLSSSQAALKSNDEIANYDHSIKVHIHQKWRELESKYTSDQPALQSSRPSVGPSSAPLLNKGFQNTNVWILISADGSLRDYKVQSMNQGDKFEARALEAVRASFPFQPLPKSAGNAHPLSVLFNHTGVY